MDYALIGYPISASFKARFEKTIGSPVEYLALSEVRKLPFWKMCRKLASFSGCRLYLLLEDETSRPILPLLQIVASCTLARSIEVVHNDLRRERVSRFSTLPTAGRMAWMSLLGRRSLRLSRCECESLLNEPRIEIAQKSIRRVLYLKTNLWFGVKAGGSVGHIAGVVNGLRSEGFELDFYGPERPTMVDQDVVFSVTKPPSSYGLPIETNLYRFGHSVVNDVELIASGKSYGFIYQRMSVGNYSGVVLSQRLRLPLVIEYNGSEVWVQNNWGKAMRYPDVAHLAEQACLKHAHVVVTVSDVLRDELIERGVEPQRIVSYPNCIDTRVFDPVHYSADACSNLRAQLGLASDTMMALFLGTFGQWHGTDVLAQAVQKMAIEHADWLRERKVHFVFVGDGGMMCKVRETLSDSRCKPFYTLTGLVPQAESPLYLAAANLLLSPHVRNADGSRFFGSPTKLFEYMAMAKGIVASDLDQIGEVLRDSLHVDRLPNGDPSGNETQVALLVPPNDVDGLIAGMRYLVDRPAWREVLGRNARTEALQKYTWQHHVRAIVGQLEAMVPNVNHQAQPLRRAA